MPNTSSNHTSNHTNSSNNSATTGANITDITGLITTLTYNFRGDVLTRTTGNLLTSYSYDPAGRLLSMSLPGNRTVSFTYSGSNIASITDSLGNVISFSYDAMGRESGRQIHDPANTLRYSLGLKPELPEGLYAHRALYDCYVTAELLLYMGRLAKWTFGEMRAISNSPSLIKAIRFGKHKGMTFEEISKVDPGYLRWLSRIATTKTFSSPSNTGLRGDLWR